MLRAVMGSVMRQRGGRSFVPAHSTTTTTTATTTTAATCGQSAFVNSTFTLLGRPAKLVECVRYQGGARKIYLSHKNRKETNRKMLAKFTKVEILQMKKFANWHEVEVKKEASAKKIRTAQEYQRFLEKRGPAFRKERKRLYLEKKKEFFERCAMKKLKAREERAQESVATST